MARLSAEPDANAELSRRYVDYYRRSVRYVMEHPQSLTSVPVLFQRVNDGLAVFDQPTDGILFGSICDSLKTVYPDSRYVKALAKEADRRIKILQLQAQIDDINNVKIPAHFKIGRVQLPGNTFDLVFKDPEDRRLSEAEVCKELIKFMDKIR